jgi:GDP-L-fucose synthase
VNNAQPRIFVAGHRGLVGSAILRVLHAQGLTNIVTRTHAELELTDQAQVRAFFETEHIDQVYLAAAKVGGIHANNTYPAEFIYDNTMVQANVVHEAWRNGVHKLLFLGSSCIYPRLAEQPIREECLMNGMLEPTNEPYAMAKIAGIKLCESYNRQYGTDYRSVMPTNLYGPGDNFDLKTSHVLAAMIRKFHEAKIGAPDEDGHKRAPQSPVVLWGSGTPRREFLHVDDLAAAVVFLLENVHAADVADALINVGTGRDQTIRDLAAIVQRVVGHTGPIEWDASRPDGTPQKQLDVSRITALGWKPAIALEDGIRSTYEWYLTQFEGGRDG